MEFEDMSEKGCRELSVGTTTELVLPLCVRAPPFSAWVPELWKGHSLAAPGFVKTPIWDKIPEEFHGQFAQYNESAYKLPLIRFLKYLFWSSQVKPA